MQPERFHPASRALGFWSGAPANGGWEGQGPRHPLSPTLFWERFPPKVSGEWGVCWGMVCGRDLQRSVGLALSHLETVRAGNPQHLVGFEEGWPGGMGEGQRAGGGSTWKAEMKERQLPGSSSCSA